MAATLLPWENHLQTGLALVPVGGPALPLWEPFGVRCLSSCTTRRPGCLGGCVLSWRGCVPWGRDRPLGETALSQAPALFALAVSLGQCSKDSWLGLLIPVALEMHSRCFCSPPGSQASSKAQFQPCLSPFAASPPHPEPAPGSSDGQCFVCPALIFYSSKRPISWFQDSRELFFVL